MSPKNLWGFCLAASLFAHFLLLNAHYQPEPVMACRDIVVPLAFDVEGPEAGGGFALRQVADLGIDGAEKGESPKDYRRRILKRYLAQVHSAVEKRKFQPPGANFRGVIGNALYAFTIDGQGRFKGVRLLRSSGSDRLDQSALTAIQKASGRVKRPKIIGTQPIAMTLTVKYQYGL